MKTKKVIALILEFIDNELISGELQAENLELSFRSDNGSQFISKAYRALIKRF